MKSNREAYHEPIGHPGRHKPEGEQVERGVVKIDAMRGFPGHDDSGGDHQEEGNNGGKHAGSL